MTGHLFTDGELVTTRSADTRDRRMERAAAVTHLHVYVHLCRGLAVWRGAQQAFVCELHMSAGAYDDWVGDRAGCAGIMIDQLGPSPPTVTIGIGFLNPLGCARCGLPLPRGAGLRHGPARDRQERA